MRLSPELAAPVPEGASPLHEAANPRIVKAITADMLAAKESQYSGGRMARKIPCAHGHKCTGSDRMKSYLHKYGHCYADLLNTWGPKFLESSSERLVVGEIGILKGTGLAMWNDVFPGAEVLGFDFVTSNTQNNLAYMKSRGAFMHGDPTLHSFDQLRPVEENIQYLRTQLGGKRFAFFVDDGLHTDSAIIDTWRAFREFMLPGGVYIIEDVDCHDLSKDACTKKAMSTFAPFAKEYGWSMRSCPGDHLWYAFLKPTGRRAADVAFKEGNLKK